MNRLKKLAGIINEDQEQGLMNKVNKISDPQTKNMLSDVAVTITDIKGYVMDLEEFYSNEYKYQHPEFIQGAKNAHDAIDALVKKLEAYITRVHG